jgi:small subunit ribosomal protein S13
VNAEGGAGRKADPLDELKIETDLRRSMQADIAHQRQVGTYRGRR